MSERLEDVRTRVGAANLRAFYDVLTARGDLQDGFPTYEAARTYHGKQHRDPPSPYLARIIETFRWIDPEWLLTGAGEPVRKTPWEKDDAIAEAFTTAVQKDADVDEYDYLHRTVLGNVGQLVRLARSVWVSHGALGAYNDSAAGRRQQTERVSEFETSLATKLGETCVKSARWFLLTDGQGAATGWPSGRLLPSTMFNRFAMRFLIATEELLPMYIDVNHTPEEWQARRQRKAMLRGQQPKEGDDA